MSEPGDADAMARLLRHLDRQLPPAEVSALMAELRGNADVRQEAGRVLLLLGQLGEVAREARDNPGRPAPGPATARPAGQRLRWALGGVALAGAVAALIALRCDPAADAPGHRARVVSPRPQEPPAPTLAKARASDREARIETRPPAGQGPTALLVRGADPENAGDLDGLIAARLQRLGFGVVELAEDRLDGDALSRSAVVVISSSTTGVVIRESILRLGLRDLPVPIVTCENVTFALLAMTGPRTSQQRGAAPRKMNVEIEPTTHPMAAGLPAGPARLADAPVPLSWGEPGEGATKIATLEGSHHRRAVLFGYESGAPMFGLLAPARRVGCFLVQDNALAITETGWQLFDAAVRWAAGR